jgi:hypothetical protein
MLTVLDGFRNVNAYRAARAKEREAFVQRELVKTARGQDRKASNTACALLQASMETSRRRLRELDARDGLVIEGDVARDEPAFVEPADGDEAATLYHATLELAWDDHRG